MASVEQLLKQTKAPIQEATFTLEDAKVKIASLEAEALKTAGKDGHNPYLALGALKVPALKHRLITGDKSAELIALIKALPDTLDTSVYVAEDKGKGKIKETGDIVS